MEGKLPLSSSSSSSVAAPSFVEFEPLCQWQREEARDVLVIHLPEFKKEQLRVQINSRGTLKISGERTIDSTKKSKFYKEVEVPKYCDTNAIQAKFANACLYLIMPKISTEQANKAADAVSATNQTNGSAIDAAAAAEAEVSQKKKESESTQTPEAAPAPSEDKQKPVSAPEQDPGSIGKEELTQPLPTTVESPSPADPKDVITEKKKKETKGSDVSKMRKICGNKSLNVAVAVALMAAIGSYILYMYLSDVLEDLKWI